MTKYVTSKALCYNKVCNGYEIVNFISGKSVKVSEFVKGFLDYCDSPREDVLVNDFFSRSHVSDDDSNGLMHFLLSHKILVHDDQDALYCVCPVAHTLFGFDACDEILIPTNNIVIAGAPFGLGNSVDIGCKDFPNHVRRYIRSFFGGRKLSKNLSSLRIDFVDSDFDMDNFESLVLKHKVKDIGDVYFCSGESNELYYKKLYRFALNVAKNDSVPFILGGDHSITYPIVKALCEKNVEFDILHFDAHSDYKDSLILNMYNRMDLKMLTHATVMNYCAEEVNVKRIVQFGVREPFMANCDKIQSVSLKDIRTNSTILQEVARSNRPIYLSFDIDFLDPIIAPGTGSKIVQGAQFEETLRCLDVVLRNKKVLGVDLVEVNDKLDINHVTVLHSIKLILYILGLLKMD